MYARLIAAITAAFIISPPLADAKAVRKEGFRAFSIVSSKTGGKITSDVIEEIMCDSPFQHLEIHMNLLKNFDIIKTYGDHSMGVVIFAGVQNGNPVRVSLATSHEKPQKLKYVFVDGALVLAC